MTELDFKTKKKDIYLPLKETLELIIKRLNELDIHLPLAQIVRLDFADRFNHESIVPLRKLIYEYLKVANKYRQIYFDYMKNTKVVFDKEMNKDGSFAPANCPVALQNRVCCTVPGVLLNGDLPQAIPGGSVCLVV